jgi:peroxiredoxin
MKYLVKTILFLILISIKVTAQNPAQTIPQFNFSNPDGSVFANKDLKQGKLLFFTFFDIECDHCQHAIQYINEHLADFKNAAIYLITLDSKDKIKIFMNKYGNNLLAKKNATILFDTKNEFITKFRPRKYPSLFLYSADQRLIMYDDNEQNLTRFSKKINMQN